MGDAAVLTVLAAAGVVSVLLFAVKGILDQLPEVFRSWHRARKAWREEPPNED